MSTNLEIIKQLRADTGAGINDVKKALDEAEGDMNKAKEILRKKGLKIAAKKQGCLAKQGIIDAYIHPPGHIAGLVSLLCETDFVARNFEFKNLAHELAKQVVAMSPLYLKIEDVPQEEIEKEKEIYQKQLTHQNHPERSQKGEIEGSPTDVRIKAPHSRETSRPTSRQGAQARGDKKKKVLEDKMINKIIEGKLAKYYEQVCLLEQPYIADDKKKIKDLITEATAKLGEKIEIREFLRIEL